MKKGLLFYLLAFIFLLISCHDDFDAWKAPVDEQDEFIGELKNFVLQEETSNWNNGEFRLKIMTEKGNIITRSVTHERFSTESTFKMKTGLKSGKYRLLYAEHEVEVLPDSFEVRQLGLGRRLVIDQEMRVKLLGTYDKQLRMIHEDSVFVITCAEHLNYLRELANDEQTNKLLLEKYTYKQEAPIDMRTVCVKVDRINGWMPIGSAPTTAFRGTFIGDTIRNLKINRGNSIGMGLFGYVQNFTAKNVVMENAEVKGHSFVGGLVGAVVTAGNTRDESYFYNCEMADCNIEGSEEGLSVGGLVGMLDQFVKVMFVDCTTRRGNLSGSYNVGGLLGGSGRYSSTFITDCVNEGTLVTGLYSCVGGLIGVADSLYMSLCVNKGKVNGGTLANSQKDAVITGTGGLVGGAGTASLLTCNNNGSVEGYWGVGGLVGSARIATDGETAVFGNLYFQQSYNDGEVKGSYGVGGLCGEAQFGGYGLYNKGTVSGEQYVGGLCGNTSIAVVQNTVNVGNVSGNSRVGGLIGKMVNSSITLSQNFAKITAQDGYIGGIVGLSGDNVILHYNSNHGLLVCNGKNPVGGIAGEVGDPRKWSNLDITYCVYGAMDMIMGPWGALTQFAGFKKVGYVNSAINVLLTLTGVPLRFVFSHMDKAKQAYNVENCFSDAEFAQIDEQINQKEEERGKEVDEQMKKLRSESEVSYVTDGGLDNTLLGEPYLRNFMENLNYCKNSEDNLNEFFENCNTKLNDLAGEVKVHEKAKEMMHSAISYITCGVSTVATVVSLFATAGTSAVLIATAVGAASTFIGGANSVWRGIDNFEENAVIISQCVNTGPFTARAGEIGGIVGVLNDYCTLHDCINAGSGPGGEGAQIVHEFGNRCEITNNLGIAPVAGWSEDELSANSIYKMDFSNFLYADGDAYCLTKADLASQKVFEKEKWNIGDASSYWVIPEAENPHPIPCSSEMK